MLDFAGCVVGDVDLGVDALAGHVAALLHLERPGHLAGATARRPEHRVSLLLGAVLQEKRVVSWVNDSIENVSQCLTVGRSVQSTQTIPGVC